MTENKTGLGLSKVGLVLTLIAGLWLVTAPLLGYMGRPWPCFFLGLAVLACVAVAWRIPHQRRGWFVLVILISASALLLGTSAIIPGLLGIAGGTLLIEWS